MRNILAILTTSVLLAQQQPTTADLPVKESDAEKVRVKVPPQPATPPVVVDPKTGKVPKKPAIPATPNVPDVAAKAKKPKLPKLKKPKGDRDLARLGKLKETALGVPSGSPLTVGMKGPDGKVQKIYGRMSDVNNDGFTMKTIRDGNLEDMKVDFKDVASVKQGAKQSKLKQMTGPVLGVMSLATLAGTIISIAKK